MSRQVPAFAFRGLSYFPWIPGLPDMTNQGKRRLLMRRQCKAENRVERKGSWRLPLAVLSWILVLTGCTQEKVAKREEAAPSAIVVTAKPGGPLVIKTPAAEFDVFPWGDVQAYC